MAKVTVQEGRSRRQNIHIHGLLEFIESRRPTQFFSGCTHQGLWEGGIFISHQKLTDGPSPKRDCIWLCCAFTAMKSRISWFEKHAEEQRWNTMKVIISMSWKTTTRGFYASRWNTTYLYLAHCTHSSSSQYMNKGL